MNEEDELLHQIANKIWNLCETDPDEGLRLIDEMMTRYPVLKTYPFLKLCKARAYQIKGLKPLLERPFINVATVALDELQRYITDENLNYIEMALLELKQIEDIDPEIINIIGEKYVDGMAVVLERCRPGRVQQILGRTKLKYFGIDRIVDPYARRGGILPPEELQLFTDIFFTSSHIVKSACLVETGKDSKGRRFILVWLFDRTFDEFGPDEKLGDAIVDEIYLFEDGTYAHSI
jgi:hypothetical protein